MKKYFFFLHVICFFILGCVYPTDHCQYCFNPSSGSYLDTNVNWSRVYPAEGSLTPGSLTDFVSSNHWINLDQIHQTDQFIWWAWQIENITKWCYILSFRGMHLQHTVTDTSGWNLLFPCAAVILFYCPDLYHSLLQELFLVMLLRV